MNDLTVDPAGELLALTTHGDVKNIIIGALELSGKLDFPALERAVSLVAKNRQRFCMPLTETRSGFKHRLVWDDSRLQDIPVVSWDLTSSHMSQAGRLDTLLNCLGPCLNRERDLFSDVPCEVHVVRHEPNLHTVAAVMSHAAADAITLLRLVKEMAGHYHAIAKGEDLGIGDSQRAASVELKRPLRKRTSAWSDYAATCKHALVPFSRSTLPQGTGWIHDHTEHHVKRVLSKEETREVFDRASRIRIFVVDYLLACGFETIKLWNQSLGVVSSSMAAALTVNLNGRVNSLSCGNNDSVLYFRWHPGPRTDLAKLGKTILRSRVKQFREGMDFKYARGMEKLNNALRVLPYSLRGRLYRSMLQKHQTSFALGYFGVLWPTTDGESGNGESYLQSMGDMEIKEVHGLAYKIFSRTPLYLSAYIFREQLNVVLSAAGWLFTTSESADFMSLFINTVRDADEGICVP